jgi:uncharacterized membrane protein YfhO
MVDTPTRVELTVTLGRPGFVVLADLFDPGWRLSVDGVSTAVWKANGLMRAAALDAGPHALVYTYDPVSLRIGAALSVAGLLGLVGLGDWALAGRGPPTARP